MSRGGPNYRFIPSQGESSASQELRRAVRSHAAAVSRSERQNRTRLPLRARYRGEGLIDFEADAAPNASDADRQALVARAADASTTTEDDRLYIDILSGETFSPISCLDTYHRAYVSGVMNHYIQNMTIPIPEIDGTTAVPLFRAVWLPIVLHDPIIFQVVMLFAATHYATFADPSRYQELNLELIRLKQAALSALRSRVEVEAVEASASSSGGHQPTASSDVLIAAAAKMASYEAIFGTVQAFHMHMSTVARLLSDRGGVSNLAMNGFLARLLSFIDTNSAFLLGTNLYLANTGATGGGMPHHQPFRPRRFDEIMSAEDVPVDQPNVQTVVNLERFIGFVASATLESEEVEEQP